MSTQGTAAVEAVVDAGGAEVDPCDGVASRR